MGYACLSNLELCFCKLQDEQILIADLSSGGSVVEVANKDVAGVCF